MDPLARIDTSRLDTGFFGLLLGFLGACKAHALDLRATMGFRDLVEQAALWDAYQKGGPRAAPPGKSAHNYGMAVDFLAYRKGALLGSSSEPEYALMEELAPRYTLKTLRRLNDAGHVELDGWELFHDVSAGNSTK